MSPRPVVGSVAEHVYSSLEPGGFTSDDEANDWALLHYVHALTLPIQLIYDWAGEDETDLSASRAFLTGPVHPGWSKLLDLDRCPDAVLPWLAQFVGVRLLPGSTPAEQRDRIRSTDGFKRGSIGAIKGAPLPHLTGTKFVQVRERFKPTDPNGDHAYQLYVATKPAETIDAAAVLAALLAQKPAGIVLHYRVTDANTDYEAIDVYHASYADLLVAYATYDAMFTFGHTYRDATTEVGTYSAATGTYGSPMSGM